MVVALLAWTEVVRGSRVRFWCAQVHTFPGPGPCTSMKPSDANDWDLNALITRARVLAGRGLRSVLGITGPPGAGKSTLAAALVDELGSDAALVPMDGFHLAQLELSRLGRADRKGSADTFDAFGYLALLDRLRQKPAETVYAPAFRRELEEPIAGAIPISSSVRLIVTEGNYLLDGEAPWDDVRTRLDEAWFVELDEPVRLSRLIARHVKHGRSLSEAQQWAHVVDQANAIRIEGGRGRADLIIRGSPPSISG